MIFNSFQYMIFLPVVFLLHWLIPSRHRWILLLIASYYFYMSWNAKYVVLILFTTLVSYLAAILIEATDSARKKKIILFGTLITCLGVLGVFKYFNFFAETLSNLFQAFSIPLHPVTLKLLLPVGISFYTFQTLSYVIDVYRGTIRAEHHFGIYATFVSFFPQLVAGPIERSGNLLHQIRDDREFDYFTAREGLRLMAWGYFKKIALADTLAVYADIIYNNVQANHGLALIIATLFFSIQIYCRYSVFLDSDLLRLLRVLGYRDRFGQTVQYPAHGKLQEPLSFMQRERVLEQMAHLSLNMVPGLCLHSSRRKSCFQRQTQNQSYDHISCERSLARCKLDLRPLGRSARFRAGAGNYIFSAQRKIRKKTMGAD